MMLSKDGMMHWNLVELASESDVFDDEDDDDFSIDIEDT